MRPAVLLGIIISLFSFVKAKADYSSVEGIVVKGSQFSRTIGFPTINLNIGNETKLRYGVYAGYLVFQDKAYAGVMNVGITPTFDVKQPKLEFYVFDFDQDMYGQKVKIIPVHYIRPEVKYENLDLLKEQIAQDVEKAKEILNYNSQKMNKGKTDENDNR